MTTASSIVFNVIHNGCILHAILAAIEISRREASMPALQVKDCPADVYEKLRKCAEEENRSISQQTLTIIEDFLDLRERKRIAEATKAKAPTANDEPHMRVRIRPIYGPEANDGIDYAARWREKMQRIRALPPIPHIDGMPSAAEMIRQIRDEEAR